MLRFLSLWRCRNISDSISSRKRAHSFPPHALIASLRTHRLARFVILAGGRVSVYWFFLMPRMYNGVIHWRNKKMRDGRIFCEKARFYWSKTVLKSAVVAANSGFYTRILNRSPASVNAPGTSTSWPLRHAAHVVPGVSLAVTGDHGVGKPVARFHARATPSVQKK